MGEPYWDRAPLRPHRLPVTITNVPALHPLFVIPLGPHEGVWIHWLGRRSICCSQHDCKHCLTLPADWAGYMPVLAYRPALPQPWEPTVLHFTSRIEDLMSGPVIGHVLELWRDPKTPNGKMQGRVSEKVPPKGMVLPPPFDIRPVLKHMWHGGRRRPDRGEEGRAAE